MKTQRPAVTLAMQLNRVRSCGLRTLCTKKRNSWIATFLSLVAVLFSMSASAVIRDGGIDPANLGKGDWIYSIKDATNRLGGHVTSVKNEVTLMQYYKSIGVRYLMVKAGTGSTNYSGCYASPNQVTTNFCNIARTNGIWIFAYTRSYGSDIPGESALADRCFNAGADGFIFDAEVEWETRAENTWITNGSAQAWAMLSMVRSNWPNKFIGHAPFPIIYLHSTFPYKEFGYWCDAVMPQIYHFSAAGIKGSPSAAINWSDVNWRTWQDSLYSLAPSNINGTIVYWTNSIKPIVPLQDVYGEVGTIAPGTSRCNGTVSAQPNEDVMEFIDYSAADPNCITDTGYKGVNFWRGDLHGTNQLAYIAAGTSGDISGVVNNIVIDDANAQVTGAWTAVKVFGATTTTPTYYGATGTDTNSFGTNYWVKSQGSGTAYIEFTPPVVEPGDYKIYEWHPYRADASAGVPFVITYNGGSATNLMNQQTNSGNWSYVGRFPFATGTSGTIRVLDNFAEPSAVATVDGLKMVFVPPAAVPATPTLLTATSAGISQIDLTWRDNATNETAYYVARSTTSGGPYVNVATLGINITNYSDTGLSQNTTYYYVVRATNYLGMSANSSQASATTASSTTPVITVPPQSQSVPLSSNVTFTVTATGSSPLFYQWRFNSTNISLATNSSYTKANVQSTDAGGYSAVVWNAFGSATSSVATLTVILPPAISSQPQSLTNIAGTSATFSVTASGTSPVYQWRKNGSPLSNGGNVSGATTATLTLSSVAQTDAATYSVIVTNAAGSITSSNATLTVLDPPSITTQPQTQSVAVGGTASFTVAASGTAPLNYQWRFNGANISGATTTSYTVSNAQLTDAGSYSVVVTNTAGTATSGNAVLSVLSGGTTTTVLSNIWNIQAGTRNYVTTSHTERGLAISRTSGHVYLVSRSAAIAGSLGIYVLDGETGTELGTLSLTGINNTAFFKLSKIGVAEDGVIYAANMTLNSSTAPFIIYRWASEAADPTVAYSGTPDGGVTARWGDSLTVKGGGTSTRIIASGSGATNVVIFTTSDGSNFTASKLNPSPNVAVAEFSKGLCFGDGDYFYSKNRPVTDAKMYSYNIAGNSCAISTTVSLLDSNMIAITVDTNRNLLFGVLDDNTTNSASHSLKAYDIANPASATVVSNFNFLPIGAGTNSNNSNFAAAVDTDGNRIVGLDTQNGIVALKIIQQNAPAIAQQPTNRTVIAGQTVNFTVSALGDAPLTYRWKRNGVDVSALNASGTTTSNLTITAVTQANAGTYTVIVTNLAGSVTSDSAVLVVIDPVVITSQPASQTNAAAGSTVQFSVSATGTEPITYEWRKNSVPLADGEFVSGSSEPTLILSGITESEAGLYSVMLSNAAGAVVSSNAALIVIDPPDIVADPEDATIGAGTNAVFSASATGTSLVYQWRRNGVNLSNGGKISGANSASLTIAGVSQLDAATYSLLISNSVGTATSAGATLTVIDPPLISSNPTSRTNNAGTTTIFNVTVLGTAPFSYEWRKNGTPVSDTTNIFGSATTSLTITNVLANDAATYSVFVQNAAGDATSSGAVLTVNDPFISANPASRTNVTGTSASFTVTAAGTDLTYQWQKDGVNVSDDGNITGTSSDILNLVSVSTTNAGTYRVVVTGAGNSVTSAPAILTVWVPVSITAQPASQTNLAGSTAMFTVAATGTAPFSYQWFRNGSPLSNSGHISGATSATLSIASVTTADEGTYTVDVTNPAGSASSDPASLTVLVPPVITSQPADLLINVGSNATFQVVATGPDLTYQWRVNGGAISGATDSSFTLLNAQTNDSGLYSVVVSNYAGVAVSSNAVLTVNTDFVSPMLKILTPTSGQRLVENFSATNYSTALRGTASDDRQVSQVLYSLNDAPFVAASGTTNWSAVITIIPGTNTVIVKAVDTGGNATTLTRKFVYVVLSPLTVNITGWGQVQNPYPNPLEVGRGYRLTAFVGAGTNFIFTNWSRVQNGTTNVVTNAAILNFIMESNMVLNANFINNPFVAASGIYNGLFYNSNAITHSSAGFFTLKVTPKLTFSGKMRLDGDNVSMSGKFALPGTAATNVFRTKIVKSNLNITLDLNFANWNDRITGTVSEGTNWTADLLGDRVIWKTNLTATQFTNGYTMLIPGFNDPSQAPTGSGYALITVNPLGKVIMSGAVADGHKISQSVQISKNGEWPLYASLYLQPRTFVLNSVLKTNKEYQGSLLGWITFATNTPAGKTNLAPQGRLSWIKDGWTNTVYPSGFAGSFIVKGSRHVRPALGERAIPMADGTITTANGNLAAAFANDFVLGTNNSVTMIPPVANTQRFSLVAKTGFITGSFAHPNNTNAVTKFFGAVLQDYNYGRGYFVGTNQTGTISIDPR